MASQLIVKPTSEEVASSACDWLIDAIREAISTRGRCVVALSGGSTPKRLYEMIAERHLHSLDWSRVHLLWGDERNVPHTSNESNYLMVQKAWLTPAVATDNPQSIPQVYPVPIQVTAPEQAALTYGETIRKVLGDSPSIDIVLLGLGDDAHTASLFPETSALASLDGFVANYVPKFEAFRMTMTAGLLNQARKIVFLVCGGSKAPALEVVWHGPKEPVKFPAQLIHPTNGELWWFTDSAAVPRSGWI
jgi:6-phosphogluconolactonase